MKNLLNDQNINLHGDDLLANVRHNLVRVNVTYLVLIVSSPCVACLVFTVTDTSLLWNTCPFVAPIDKSIVTLWGDRLVVSHYSSMITRFHWEPSVQLGRVCCKRDTDGVFQFSLSFVTHDEADFSLKKKKVQVHWRNISSPVGLEPRLLLTFSGNPQLFCFVAFSSVFFFFK